MQYQKLAWNVVAKVENEPDFHRRILTTLHCIHATSTVPLNLSVAGHVNPLGQTSSMPTETNKQPVEGHTA